MKKMICMAMVTMLLVSLSTAAFADGRRGQNHGGNHGGGGVSTGAAIGIGVGAFILGTINGSSQQQEAPVQYYTPQMYQYPAPAPSFMPGTCFPQGAYFSNGIVIVGRGFYPTGTQVTPGYCFY